MPNAMYIGIFVFVIFSAFGQLKFEDTLIKSLLYTISLALSV